MNGSIKMNYMSRLEIARKLGTTWRRVDQAVRSRGLEPCICGRLCYDFDQAREAVLRMQSLDSEAQKDASLAAAVLRERAGDEALVRWAEDFIGPLVRTAKGWR
jgi:hypothetical protein